MPQISGQRSGPFAYNPLVTRVITALSLTTTLALALAPQLASATLCEVCDNTIACSDPTEICLGGLPETDAGRCTTPCPNPSAQFGGCPTNYTCVPLTGGEQVCVPRSDDCTSLTSFTPRSPGQTCTTQSCTQGALCVGGVCSLPCTGLGQPGCPGGQFCGFIGLPDNPFFICGNGIGEGQVCNDGDVCQVGICLTDQNMNTLCYRNCGTGAGASSCSAAQTCANIPLQSGDSIDICQPPQSGPGPDAGFPDSGIWPDATTGFPDATSGFPDATTNPNPDAGEQPGRDAQTMNPGDDAQTMNPGDDAATNPGADAGSGSPDRSSGGGGGGGGVVRRSSGCTTLDVASADGLLLLLLPALLLISGRRRARS